MRRTLADQHAAAFEQRRLELQETASLARGLYAHTGNRQWLALAHTAARAARTPAGAPRKLANKKPTKPRTRARHSR